MQKYRVIALYCQGIRNEPYKSGDIVEASEFHEGHAELLVADGHLERYPLTGKEAKADEKAKAEAAQKEADEKAKAEAAQKEADEKAKAEAAQKEADEKAKAEAAQKEADEKAKAEAAQKEADEKAKAEAAQKEADEKAKAEAAQKEADEKNAENKAPVASTDPGTEKTTVDPADEKKDTAPTDVTTLSFGGRTYKEWKRVEIEAELIKLGIKFDPALDQKPELFKKLLDSETI